MPWKTAYSELPEAAIVNTDALLVLDVSDTTMAASGTQKYYKWQSLKADMLSAAVPSVKRISDYSNNIATAVAAIGATETTLLIDAATAGDATVPVNINLLFLLGGLFTGVVTIYSPSNVIASPEQQIFSAASTPRFTVIGEIHLGWFGTKGDCSTLGVGTNDAAALLAGIACARATHGGVGTFGATLSGVKGRTYLSESALFVGGNTATGDKWVYKLKNLCVYAKHTGYAVDYTGAHGKEIENLHVIGDATTKPKVLLFFARKDNSSSAGQHTFLGKNSLTGHVSICGHANYSGEEGTYNNLQVRVSSGISAAIFTDTGYYYSAEEAGFLQFPQINMDSDPGKISCITHKHNRCRFEHIGSGEAEYVSHVQLIGADQWSAYDAYFGSAAGGDATSVYVKLMTDSDRSGSSPNYPRITNSLFHAAYKQAVQFVNGTCINPVIKGNTYGGTGATDADIVAGGASVVLYDPEIEATSLDFSAATCDILDNAILKIGLGSTAGSVNISQRFQGNLYIRSTTTLTLGGSATYVKGTVHEVDTGRVYTYGKFLDYMAKQNAPGTGNITLAAADIIGGLIIEDPEGNATWTTDTATNIVALIPNCRTGNTFQVVLHNAATNGSSEVVTIAGGDGVTLYGETLTLTEGTNTSALIIFRVSNAATPTIEGFVITGT